MDNNQNLEIFTAIADLVIQAEFTKAQDDFFMKNQDKFEDTEENKLEYTNIYTEYVYILEQMIEMNLKDRYTDDQIESFYETFKDNLQAYEKVNPEVVDSLFGFIDFEKFKKSILLSKNMDNENFKKADRTDVNFEASPLEKTNAFMKSLVDEDINDPALGWRQAMVQKEDKGFSSVVY